jgi:hypothetical protein
MISDNLDRITQIPFQTKNLFRKIAARGAGAAGTGKREQATYGNVGGRHSPLGNLVTPPPTQSCAQSAMFRRVGGLAPPHYRSLTRNRAIRDTGDMQLAHRRRRDRDAELCSHQRDHRGDLRSHFNDHGLVPGSNPAFRHAPTFGVVDRRADRTWKQQTNPSSAPRDRLPVSPRRDGWPVAPTSWALPRASGTGTLRFPGASRCGIALSIVSRLARANLLHEIQECPDFRRRKMARRMIGVQRIDLVRPVN